MKKCIYIALVLLVAASMIIYKIKHVNVTSSSVLTQSQINMSDKLDYISTMPKATSTSKVEEVVTPKKVDTYQEDNKTLVKSITESSDSIFKSVSINHNFNIEMK